MVPVFAARVSWKSNFSSCCWISKVRRANRWTYLWSQAAAPRRCCGRVLLAGEDGPSAGVGIMKDVGNGVVLDREVFRRKLHLKALRVPKEQTHFVSKTLLRFTLNKQRLKHVVHDPVSDQSRLVLLDENVDESSLPEDKLKAVRDVIQLDIVPYEIELNYSHFSVEQVLTDVLPSGCKAPASFETVGHIAHLNLTDELLPYKKVIAEVFLDKNLPRIRTVVNKVGTISNEYRVPTWEVLAGDNDLVTEVKQHKAVFRLDFGLVYWNSRLEFEHKRLVSQFSSGQVVVDMFAGIGPFVIPAVQKGCLVLANDLNPDSIKYLNINAKLNKVEERIRTYNMDARGFVRHIVQTMESAEVKLSTVEDQNQNGAQDLDPPSRDTASGDSFRGLLSKRHWRGPMPRVHCYCFMKALETQSEVLKRAEGILGGVIENPEVWIVRDVAPNKIMLCISFDLPESAAFAALSNETIELKASNGDPSCGNVNAHQEDQVLAKRPRTDS